MRRGLKVSWENGHDRAKFKAAFAALRAANCGDEHQRYWTTLELVPAAPELAFTWELRAGATPALLAPGYCLLASLLGLGWLYEARLTSHHITSHGTTRHGTARHGMAWHDVTRHAMTWHDMA